MIKKFIKWIVKKLSEQEPFKCLIGKKKHGKHN